VSRQLVVAVETGVNRPAVDAALGLARALGTTVEELFSDGNVAVVALSNGRGHDVNLADARPRAGILK
jgi:DNA-binding XRE family transcriptional regulator